MPYVYQYPRASNTATITLLVEQDDNSVGAIIGTRKAGGSAYPGFECIPGGFVDVKAEETDYVVEGDESYHILEIEKDELAEIVKPGETVEAAAIREVEEETGLKITEDRLRLYHVSSKPDTDPRCHVVNTCFYVVLTQEEAVTAKAGDDLSKIRIGSFNKENPAIKTFAFDHARLLSKAMKAYWHDRLVAEALEFYRKHKV